MGQPLKSIKSGLPHAALHLRLALALIEDACATGTPAGAAASAGGLLSWALTAADAEHGHAAGDGGAAMWQRFALNALSEGDYLTNDIVDVRGHASKQGTWELKVNGGPALKLDRRGFILLKILIAFAHHLAALRKQGRPQADRFFPVAAIVSAIIIITADGTPLAGFWPAPIESDVHRSVGKLRKQLRKAGWPSLLESGPRGAGYRLSTPAGNLVRGSDEEAWLEVVRQALETAEEL